MHMMTQVVRHGFRPTVSIWLISFHIYMMYYKFTARGPAGRGRLSTGPHVYIIM